MEEYEKKILLSESEYFFLLESVFDKVLPVKQTNHYFDTPDRGWNRLGVTCRIREKNGVFTATVKTHLAEKQNCSLEDWRRVMNERDTTLFDGMNVEYCGKLETERLTIYKAPSMVLSLDKNHYLGIEDYELEIEYAPENAIEAEQELRLLWDILCHSHRNTDMAFVRRAMFSNSKSERFFKREQTLKKHIFTENN